MKVTTNRHQRGFRDQTPLKLHVQNFKQYFSIVWVIKGLDFLFARGVLWSRSPTQKCFKTFVAAGWAYNTHGWHSRIGRGHPLSFLYSSTASCLFSASSGPHFQWIPSENSCLQHRTVCYYSAMYCTETTPSNFVFYFYLALNFRLCIYKNAPTDFLQGLCPLDPTGEFLSPDPWLASQFYFLDSPLTDRHLHIKQQSLEDSWLCRMTRQ